MELVDGSVEEMDDVKLELLVVDVVDGGSP